MIILGYDYGKNDPTEVSRLYEFLDSIVVYLRLVGVIFLIVVLYLIIITITKYHKEIKHNMDKYEEENKDNE